MNGFIGSKKMVLFLQDFLAFALGLVSFALRDMFRAYTPSNVAGTTLTEAGHVGEEQKRKVRCKEPPSFSGEQDMFSEWLFSMEESIKALKPDDAVAFVGSYLEGNAKKWFMNLCTDGKRPASWNLFKEQLISAFKSEHDDERNRLLLVQLRQSGDLETYIINFLKRCLLAKDVDELTKSALFVTGLSDSQVRRDVRRAHPKTLQDAIRAVRTSYEDLQVDTPVPSSNAVSARLRQLKRRDSGTRLSAEERQRLMREGRCFRCRELGHRAVNCPLVKGPTPLSPVFNHVKAKKNPPPAEDPNESRQ